MEFLIRLELGLTVKIENDRRANYYLKVQSVSG